MTDATTEERVRRLADNALLMLASRWAMVSMPVILTFLVTLGGMYLDARFAEQTQAISAIDQRVRTVEAAQSSGQQAVGNLQGQLALANQAVLNTNSVTATFETSTGQRLDKMTDALNALSNQVSALNATVQLQR